MKKTFTVLLLGAWLFAACNNHDKPATSTGNASGMDTIKTDSGITIVKDKEGKIVQTFKTPPTSANGQPNTNKGAGANFAGYNEERPYYIKGTLINGGGGNVTLDRLNIGNDIKPLQVNTCTKDGQFGFVGNISEPQLMQLRMPAGNIHLVVWPNDTIDVTTTLEHTIDYKVTGSIESIRLRQMYDILEKANSKKDEVEDRLKNARENQPLYNRLSDLRAGEYASIESQKHEDLRNFIKRNDTSFTCMMAALYLDPEQDIEFMKDLDKKMVLRYPSSKFYQALHEKVNIYGPIATGMTAPEIISQTPEGNTVKLSSYRGKYVLLSFWASYDLTIKEDAKTMHKLYDKYKSKGLEIVSYTVEKDKKAWIKAIEDNKMNWVNMSDLLGYQSAGAGTYIITQVPTNFLIDKEGHIVARNVRGSELSKKLAQLIH